MANANTEPAGPATNWDEVEAGWVRYQTARNEALRGQSLTTSGPRGGIRVPEIPRSTNVLRAFDSMLYWWSISPQFVAALDEQDPASVRCWLLNLVKQFSSAWEWYRTRRGPPTLAVHRAMPPDPWGLFGRPGRSRSDHPFSSPLSQAGSIVRELCGCAPPDKTWPERCTLVASTQYVQSVLVPMVDRLSAELVGIQSGEDDTHRGQEPGAGSHRGDEAGSERAVVDPPEHMPPPDAPEEDAGGRDRWSHARTNEPALTGWAAILEAANATKGRPDSQQRRLRRLNEETDGPIHKVRGRMTVNPGELTAWLSDAQGQAKAADEARRRTRAAIEECGERGGARAADLGMHVTPSPRGGRTRQAKARKPAD